MKLRFLAFILSLIVLSSLPHHSADAASIDLGISPPILQIEALPPANIQTPFAVENGTDQTIQATIELKPFRANLSDNGEVAYLKPNDPLLGANPTIFKKIQVRENDHVITNITLGPKQKKTLSLHIGIEKQESPSDYYFSILFVTTPQTTSETSNTTTGGGIGLPVLLSIGPKGKAAASITEFSAPIIIDNGPVPFTIKVANKGSYYVTVSGAIQIKNMFGQLIGKVDLLPVNVLAQSSRNIPDRKQADENETNAVTAYKIEERENGTQLRSPVAVWPESFLLGPYHAEVVINYADGQAPVRKSLTFIGLPTTVFVSGLVILSIILLIHRKLKTRLRN